MKALHHPYFVNFIIYFNDNQDFFECHEVLEDYWKSVPNFTKDHPLTAYILLATGLYHWRRENFLGAKRTLQKAYVKMTHMQKDDSSFTKGIDFTTLYARLQNSIQSVEEGQPFVSFPIIVTSSNLQKKINQQRAKLILLPKNSDLVIHKHLRRDRTEIIRLRNEKKKGRH